MASAWKVYTKERKHELFNKDVEQNLKEAFYFIQAADSQYGLTVAYPDRSRKPEWSVEIALTEKAVKCINALQPRPRFVVICGDLVDAFPEEDATVRAQQEEDFKRVFSKIDSSIPLICVCGNHDVGNQPTHKSVKMYRSSFGDDFFSFWCNGILFIVLNSQYYFDPSSVSDIKSEQDTWLDEVLSEGKKAKARIIVFQHIPWFINQLDEPDEYFNLPLKDRSSVLEKFNDSGVTHIFCGHLHYNAFNTYKSMELVTTSALGLQLGKDTHGMRIVRVSDDRIQHSYHTLDDFPKKVEL